MSFEYLNGKRLYAALLSGAEAVCKEQEALNRMNVFPVPDGDTGSNMSATFISIIQGLKTLRRTDLLGVAHRAAESALYGARGNSGAILAQFFEGAHQAIVSLKTQRLTPTQLATAMLQATDAARRAVAEPVEGTILTVMQAWATALVSGSQASSVEELMERGFSGAQKALSDTPAKLPALARAGVVDAGAQGFVHFLSGIRTFISSGKLLHLPHQGRVPTSVSTRRETSDLDPMEIDFEEGPHSLHIDDLHYQYCTECLLHGEDLNLDHIRHTLKPWGNSLVVVGNSKKVRIHIHTNDSHRVFQHIRHFGDILHTKADDMWAQYRARIHSPIHRELALVTDSSCSLPQEWVVRHNIFIIPLQVTVNQKRFLDRINLKYEEFLDFLKKPKHHVSTSQPTPADFHRTFQLAQQQSQRTLGIFLSSAASGTFQAARIAASSEEDAPIRVIDSKNAGPGLGLVLQIAAEAQAQKLPYTEIERRVHYAIAQVQTFLAPVTLKYLIQGGRVNRPIGRLAERLGLLPLLQMVAGRVKPCGLSFGLCHQRWRFRRKLLKAAQKLEQPRFLIAHAEAPEETEALVQKIKESFGSQVVVEVTTLSPALLAHAGPGAITASIFGFSKKSDIF